MSCADIPDWYLRHHLAVLDLRSKAWRAARAELLPPGYAPSVCARRLVAAGRLRRLEKGVYAVIDPVREIAPIALASGVFADLPHYVTTDAALAFHGLLDQPIPTITVVLPRTRRPVEIGGAVVRPVVLGSKRFDAADAYRTTADGFPLAIAGREQAVIDALAEPAWMVHGSLLPEVLAAFDDAELARTVDGVLARSIAAAQRLGYLLEDAGREPPPALAVLRPVRAVRLRPGRARSAPYSSRWRVYG